MGRVIHKRKNNKISAKEFQSGVNICKRLASDYYKKNNYYTYEEYLSTSYYSLTRAIKYFDRNRASFVRITYVTCHNDLSMMINTIDKKYNYKDKRFEPKFIVDYSINEPIKSMRNKNVDDGTLEDLVGKEDDITLPMVKDYIQNIFDDLYNSFNSRAERFKVNKDRDIKVVSLICKGYTPMEVSLMIGISNQLVNSIINKFKNYAIQNNLVYKIY